MAGFRTLCNLGTPADLGDGRLIERFLAADGEARELAFRALVDRHGPMVVRACRSVLKDEHEAQDVAQDVFLTLARRAATLRRREAIGPWLHRVSLRAALRSRRESARRAEVGRALAGAAPVGAQARPFDDAAEILHEEIDRLPRRSREAVVACDLEGLAYAAAAARLGIPVRTFQSRLHRGRTRLKLALIRRGVGLGLADLVVRSRVEAAPISAWAHGVARRAGGELALPSAVAWLARCAAVLVAGTAIAGAGSLATAPAALSAAQEPETKPKSTSPAPATAALLAPFDRDEARRVLREASWDLLAIGRYERDIGRDPAGFDQLAIGAVAAAQAKAGDPDGARRTLEAAEKKLIEARAKRIPAGIPDFGPFVSLARTAQDVGFPDLSRRLIDAAEAGFQPGRDGKIVLVVPPSDVLGGRNISSLDWGSSSPILYLSDAVHLLRRQGRPEQAALLARRAQRVVVDLLPRLKPDVREYARDSVFTAIRVASVAILAGVHDDFDEAIQEGGLQPDDRPRLMQQLLHDAQGADAESSLRLLSIVRKGIAEGRASRLEEVGTASLLAAAGEGDEVRELIRGGLARRPGPSTLGGEIAVYILLNASRLQAGAGHRDEALATLRLVAEWPPDRPRNELAPRSIESIADRQAELGDCDGAAKTLELIPEGGRTSAVLLKLARGFAIDGREDRASEFLTMARANWREPPADFKKALFDDPRALRASLDVLVSQFAYLDRLDESVTLVRGLPDEQERQMAYGGMVQIQAERGAFARALRLAKADEIRDRPAIGYKYLANGIRWRLEAEARLKKAMNPAPPR
ncbi:MAG: hypothetical protein BGO49_02495 [Planctomycetales bacterium 71-10]|nr:MAG: hypothetical protein BGO49_02495 [Planctomycetales bacterium 71-10]